MDYDSSLHEPRTNAEQIIIGDDLRVSYESRRLPYYEKQLQPSEDYDGFLSHLDDDEARALMVECLRRFPVHDWRGLLLPPTELPGFVAEGYDEESAAAQLIEIGVKYALAIIRSEPRAMHLRWQDAEALVSKIRRDAEDALYEQQAQQSMLEDRARHAIPQFVYFIGAETGPIKIGIAVNPENRLKGLQTSHHEKLAILATVSGDLDTEKAYHRRFKRYRIKGEWFERCPEIEAEIESLAA